MKPRDIKTYIEKLFWAEKCIDCKHLDRHLTVFEYQWTCERYGKNIPKDRVNAIYYCESFLGYGKK